MDGRRGAVEHVVHLLVAKLVRTKFYVVLDVDAVLVRPATACDFFDRHGRAVASFSPHFASSNATTNDALRVVGVVGADVRWSGDVLGIERVAAENGFYGGTPAVLSTAVARGLLAFLERKYASKTWWEGAGPRLSATVVVATLSPLAANAAQTASTLNYAGPFREAVGLFGMKAKTGVRTRLWHGS